MRNSCAALGSLVATFLLAGVGTADDRLQIERRTIAAGDAEWDWTQARTAYVPGESPLWLTTMSRTAKQGVHGYYDVFSTISQDAGRTWSTPASITSLRRVPQADGYDVVPGDLWPKWHQTSGKILITGKTFNFAEGRVENILREQVAYAVIDPQTGKCGPLNTLAMPQRDHQGESILAPNSGCHQRVDLPGGEILLPVRYQQSKDRRNYTSIVARCRFDGEKLTYIEHGSEHSIPSRRGLYEPSVTMFDGEYFLTMRADDDAWVARSSDGIHYSPHQPWTFDDGASLGSYNTQQHLAAIGGKLYLIYTRRGAGNDHIFRHRAPLFIARVDPQKLQVIRTTEQVLVPENDATLGNSGVCRISENETWVTVAEGRVSHGARQGETNRVILAKITSSPAHAF